MKKVCILLVLITYVYQNSRLKKRKVCHIKLTNQLHGTESFPKS